MNDEEMRVIFDKMCQAGWLSGYCYEDGKRVRLNWTPDGNWQADQISGLAKLYDVKQNTSEDLIPIPDGLAKSLIWETAVSKVKKDGKPLIKNEENILFHVLVHWHD